MVNEKALANSFSKVKRDISKIEANLLEISGKQAEIFEMIFEIRKSMEKKPASSKKKKR